MAHTDKSTAVLIPPPPSDIPLHVTLSIFRLAHKHDAASLVLRTAEYLNFLFPLHREVLLSIAAGDDSYLRIKGNAATLLQMLLDLLGIAHTISEIDWIIPCAIFVMVNRYEAGIIVKHPCYANLCPRLKTMINECSNSVNTTWASFLPVWNCVDPLVCYYMSKTVQADSPLSPARYFVVNAVGPPGSVLSFCHHCQEAGRWHLSESESTCWGCHPGICGFASWNAVMEKRDTEMENSQ